MLLIAIRSSPAIVSRSSFPYLLGAFMSFKVKLLLVAVLLAGLYYLVQNSGPAQQPQAAAPENVGRLSAKEVEKQAKQAIATIVARKDAKSIKESVELLRTLATAPELPLDKLAERREGISQLERVAISLQLRQGELNQRKDEQLAKMQQADAAMEMLVAPQASGDAYLDGLLKQYKDYSGTLQLVLKALFAEPTIKAQEAALVRLQGMAPTALDNVRVLGLEIKGLAENPQVKGGVEALEQLLQPEKGSVAAWMTLTHDQELMARQADELLARFHP